MCGLFAGFSKKKNFDKNTSIECLNMISHRGNDGTSLHFEDKLVLGHNRLAIEGDNGQQPIFNSDKSVLAIINGEFYDYKDIKKSLIKEGFNFTTDTDSEIVIPLYLKYGISNNFFEKLNGEFSGIIVDLNINKAFAFRDRFGIKPLYYLNDNEEIYFSSEIKAFKPIKNFNWNSDALKSVLTMQYHSHETTLIDNVKQVPPASFITICLKTLNINKNKYWDFTIKEDSNLDFEESKYFTRNSIINSVSRRIRTDKKVGITLSGGIDSSIIFALASQLSNKPLDAYSISFKNGGRYDERKYAEKMCNLHNGNFIPIEIDEIDVLSNLESAVFHSEEVSINNHLSSKFILFKEMKKNNVKVSLSGEGSDELFLGYPHFRLDLKNSSSVINNNDYLSGIQTPDREFLNTDIIKKVLNGFVPKFLEAKYSMGFKIFNGFIKNEFAQSIEDPFLNEMKIIETPNFKNNVYKSSYIWSKICLSNYILVALGDKMEMASTIEGRVPFLDKDVYETASKIPLNYKIKDGNEKYILKESFKDVIIPEIYNKQKHPFVSPPLLSWGKNENYTREIINDILNSKSLREHEFFDNKKIINTLSNIKDDELSKYDPIIMLFLTLYYFEKNFIG